MCTRYYWQNITRDIKTYVSSCDKCQRTNPKLQKQSSQLHPIKVQPQVWKRVGIDLVGPLQTTRNGNKYLITCTDYFSKWVEAEALPNKSAHTVAKFLFRLICRLGCFEYCHSDQGREFVNDLNTTLFQMAGIEHRISSAYHPQSNGLDERTNQTISCALIKVINQKQDDWDEHIDSILFSYRTSVHASTKYTPFFLMYGRDPVLPIELRVSTFHTTLYIATSCYAKLNVCKNVCQQ